MKLIVVGVILSCLVFPACGANPTSETSNYPADYDTDTGSNGDWPLLNSGDPLSIYWSNRARNSVDTIQRELGINPSGTKDTVDARLDSEHDEDGKHSSVESAAFNIGSSTVVSDEGGTFEDPPRPNVYQDVALLFGSQYVITDQGHGAPFECFIRYLGQADQFEFSSPITAPNLVTRNNANTFSAGIRIGANDFNTPIQNGRLYIGSAGYDGSNTNDDLYQIYASSGAGLVFESLVEASQNFNFVSSNFGNVYLTPSGTDKTMGLTINSTGVGLSEFKIGLPAASSSFIINYLDNFILKPLSTTEFAVSVDKSVNNTIIFRNARASYVLDAQFEDTVAVGGLSASGAGAALRTTDFSATTNGFFTTGLNVGSAAQPASSGYHIAGTKFLDTSRNASFNTLNLHNSTIRTDHAILRLPNRTSDPSTDNQEGDMYWKSDTNELRVFDGTAWVTR